MPDTPKRRAVEDAPLPKEPLQRGDAPAQDSLRIKVDFALPFGKRGWLEVFASEFGIEGVTGHRFAVHNDVSRSGEYAATHIATGLLIGRGATPDAAIESARTQWLACPPESLALKMIRAKNMTGLNGDRVIVPAHDPDGIWPEFVEDEPAGGATKAWSGELPELPHTNYNGYSDGSEPLYTAEQMRDYASSSVGGALEAAAQIAKQKYEARATTGHAREASTARALESEIRAINKLAPAGAAAAQVGARELPPAEQITDAESARVFLTAWHNEHFPTDRTFHRYIMGRDKHRALAGDFAWQLAKALVAISAPGMPPQSAPTESVMRAHDWNRSMIGVKALLSCTEGELECIGEKLLDTYIEEVNAVYSAMSAYVIPTPAAPQSAVAVPHGAWKRAILYTDTIRGTQTCRDDLWAITTAELRVLEAAAPTDAASEQGPTEREALIACLQDDAAKLADANPDDEMAQTMREAAALLDAASERKPLTKAWIDENLHSYFSYSGERDNNMWASVDDIHFFARAIEQHHGIGTEGPRDA